MGFSVAVLKCVINVLRSQRLAFDYNFHNSVEAGVAGLYAFWLDSGACLYIGMSTNIKQRMYQHRLNEHNSNLESYFKAFAQRIEVSYIALHNRSGTDLRNLEKNLINVLRPLTNVA